MLLKLEESLSFVPAQAGVATIGMVVVALLWLWRRLTVLMPDDYWEAGLEHTLGNSLHRSLCIVQDRDD